MDTEKRIIGQLKESSLHEQLKDMYREKLGGETECALDGYIADLYTGSRIIEIQTGNFSNIGRKLLKLLDFYDITLVYPLVRRKELLLYDEHGTLVKKRKSPLRGVPAHAAKELIRIPALALHPRFTFELLLVSVREARADDGKGSWRRKGVSIVDRELISVDEVLRFTCPSDYLSLLPASLPDEFTNRDIADHGKLTLSQASKLSWFLSRIGVITREGKRGRSYLYYVADTLGSEG